MACCVGGEQRTGEPRLNFVDTTTFFNLWPEPVEEVQVVTSLNDTSRHKKPHLFFYMLLPRYLEWLNATFVRFLGATFLSNFLIRPPAHRSSAREVVYKVETEENNKAKYFVS